MKIRMQKGLPYVQVSLVYAGQHKTEDVVHRIHGVGGAEFVYSKHIDCLSSEKFELKDFEIEIGTMDCGLRDCIVGIVGMNFLHRVGACIDLAQLEIY